MTEQPDVVEMNELLGALAPPLRDAFEELGCTGVHFAIVVTSHELAGKAPGELDYLIASNLPEPAALEWLADALGAQARLLRMGKH